MTALEKSTRRKIFYGMLVLFFMIIPAVILYSRGYIFDWARRSLIETGGIFVKANHSGAKVIIDSEALKETSFISGGALVTNLLPRRYTLRLEKEGYQPWQKVVRVSSQEVLEFRNVFLPPATITPQIVYNIRRDEPSRLVMLSGRAELGLEVGDPSGPFTVFAINPETRLARINIIQARRWFWDVESQTFFIARQESGRLVWYRLGIGPGASFKEERIVFRGMPQGFSSDDVRPHPRADGEFYFFAGGALFLQGRASVPVPIAEEMHSYAISPEHIYFVTKNGFFVESNLDGRETKILGRKGLFL
ncbi:MAG: PEGA domain-containing protein, partial [Patescibacteria group bacterium]